MCGENETGGGSLTDCRVVVGGLKAKIKGITKCRGQGGVKGVAAGSGGGGGQ